MKNRRVDLVYRGTGWMYQAGIEWILGLRRSAQRLYICPCIPSQWVQFSVSYRYGRTRYLITVKNPSRKCSGVTGLQIDGQVISPGEEKEGSYVELHDDGQLHHSGDPVILPLTNQSGSAASGLRVRRKLVVGNIIYIQNGEIKYHILIIITIECAFQKDQLAGMHYILVF